MSKEKQIEELSEFFYRVDGTTYRGGPIRVANYDALARALYNAGYRKQSEGEWQKAPDGTHWCSECGHDATYTFDGTEICGVACPFCGVKMKGVREATEQNES